MKTITLSDHTQAQATAAATERTALESAAVERYQQALKARQVKTDQLRMNCQREFGEQRYLLWLIAWVPRLLHHFSAKPTPPLRLEAGREEIVWNAGSQGEQKVATLLSKHLSDDWTLVSGYRNAGGEIDQILVGPNGVLAIEIKFINGTVSCDGDQWWSDKYDKYGNLVEKGKAIQDKGGRGPSAQVNAAADRLQAFLSKQCGLDRVARAVVFSHDASKVEQCKRPTVDVITTLAQWNIRQTLAQLPSSPIVEPAKVVSTIQRDHDFHSSRRRKSE